MVYLSVEFQSNWSEPERAPHSHILKMSVCVNSQVCAPGPPVVWGQFLCGRASCCNVKAVSSSLTKTAFLLCTTKTIMVCLMDNGKLEMCFPSRKIACTSRSMFMRLLMIEWYLWMLHVCNLYFSKTLFTLQWSQWVTLRQLCLSLRVMEWPNWLLLSQYLLKEIQLKPPLPYLWTRSMEQLQVWHHASSLITYSYTHLCHWVTNYYYI